LNSLFVNIK